MPEEKLVFLKREEIKTMAKDMARLLEQEALREKERVGQLKVEEKLKKETLERQKLASTMIPKQSGTEEKIPEPTLPSKTIRRDPWRKILIRAGVVVSFLLFLLSIALGYWYFLVRPRQRPSPSPTQLPVPSATFSPSAPPITPSPAIIPEPLIKTDETKIIKILPSASLLVLSAEVLKESSPQFSQLAVQKDEKFLDFSELLTELQVKAPDNILESIKEGAENLTFFLYSGKDGGRLGFVVKLKEEKTENMSQNLKTWEAKMASDFNDVLIVLGKTKPVPSNIFREAKYNGFSFRYLSLAEKNLGLCWTIRHDYLILTTSGESLLETMKLNSF